MRWIVVGVLAALAVSQIPVPPGSHGTRFYCLPPSRPVLGPFAEDEREKYLVCIARFIEEQQRATDEHSEAIRMAVLRLQTFAVDH